jgi:hypothetical protein
VSWTKRSVSLTWWSWSALTNLRDVEHLCPIDVGYGN